MKEWKEWQNEHYPSTSRNRFLFQEGKKFFETPYNLKANVERSLVREMEDWSNIHDTLNEVTFSSSKTDIIN